MSGKNTAFRECKKNNADVRTYQTVHEYKLRGHCRPMHALSLVIFWMMQRGNRLNNSNKEQ